MQMNEKMMEFNRKLYSDIEWRKEIEACITDHFIHLGFQCPEDFMKIRVYDFLNLDMVDNNRAEEMVVALSKFLIPDREDYSQIYVKGTNEKVLNWLCGYVNWGDITLRELICDKNLCIDEMQYIFDCISMSFYHSAEYNSRKYRYNHLSNIKYLSDVEIAESTNMTDIKRGQIYMVNLSPVVGSEQGGIRPCVVIQNDIGNRFSPTVIVAAITGRIKKRLPTHTVLKSTGLLRDSICLLEQIRTIDKSRLLDYVGEISKKEMDDIVEALSKSLDI